MRFMVIVKASPESEAGVMPSEEELAAMAAFNEQMVKAGILLDGAGLKPTARAVRIRADHHRRTLVDGPFTETKELVAGYWIIEVKSMEEAIEWMMRAPNTAPGGGELEIRPFFELEDFGESAAVAHHRELGEVMARGGR